jgi:hypothetical protein
MKCECTEKGFCVRYNRQMTANMVRICQCDTEKCEKYKALWLKMRKTLIGDVIHAVAKVTGVAAVVKLVSKIRGKECNCPKRRKELNEAHAKRLEKQNPQEG